MTISLGNYREWLPFAFIIIGVVLALIAAILKPENKHRKASMQLLENFRASLHAHDMEHWKEVYLGTREAIGAPAGHFINRIGKPVPLVSMWAVDSEDHTAIQHMAEGLEKVCAEILAHPVDIKMIWSEIGQLMEAMHDWLEDIPGMQQDLTFLEEQYPSLKQVFDKYGNRFKKWPYHVYVNR